MKTLACGCLADEAKFTITNDDARDIPTIHVSQLNEGNRRRGHGRENRRAAFPGADACARPYPEEGLGGKKVGQLQAEVKAGTSVHLVYLRVVLSAESEKRDNKQSGGFYGPVRTVLVKVLGRGRQQQVRVEALGRELRSGFKGPEFVW